MAGMKFPVTSTASDRALCESLKARKAAALGQLYDFYGDLMYGLAVRILNNRQEAEDLIQEVFLALWRNCSYNPDRGSFKTFLMVLVRSRALDRLRAEKTNRHALERSGQNTELHRNYSSPPMEEVVSDEISQRVQGALADLPETQRQALALAYFEGRTQTEIAHHLNVPVGTVKSWFRLGFTKLRNSLQDLID